ncbi:MAG: ankyrin repeat domain-containing protein [Chlamydiota bacterium]
MSNSTQLFNQNFNTVTTWHSSLNTTMFPNICAVPDNQAVSPKEYLPEEDKSLLQERINQIAREMERRNNNLGYGVGVFLRRSFENIASSFTSLIDSTYRTFHYYVYGNSELHFSILNKDHEMIADLAGNVELINSVNNIGESPLMTASKMGNSNTVMLLIKKGAKIDQRDINGRTPLHYASQSDSLEVAKVLINAGTEVSAIDTKGNNCIHLAAETGSLDMIKLFHNQQVPIDDYNAADLTPAMVATINKKQNAASLLLDLGADMTKRGNEAESLNIFEVALSEENDEVLNILIDRGVSEPVMEPMLPKNEATALFEEIIRKLLQDPMSVMIEKRWNADNRFSIEITVQGQTHNLSKIFRMMTWEAVHFNEEEYLLLKSRLSSFDLSRISQVEGFIRSIDYNTDSFRYSFGTNYKKKYKGLNEVDKALIFFFTEGQAWELNDLLTGNDENYSLNFHQLLPKLGFFVNALNKIGPDKLEHFVCRGQTDKDKNDNLVSPRFVSISRISKACKLYATKGKSAKANGGGHVVFFKYLNAYDISGLSRVPLAAEYVTLPKIIVYTKELFNSTEEKGGLPYYFGRVSSIHTKKTGSLLNSSM